MDGSHIGVERAIISIGKKDIREMIVYKMDGEHRIDFSLPYGDFTIDAVLEIAEQDGMVWDMYGCPYLTTGIRQIYEMIPEFA